MREAILIGLQWGLTVGFALFAFMLTGTLLWACIEGLNHILDYIFGGNTNGRRGKNIDDC